MHKSGLATYPAATLRPGTDVAMVADIEVWMGSAVAHPFNGNRVEKWTGEARWHGVCLVTYMTGKGGVRHLVEVEPQGFQMIAVSNQLRLAPLPDLDDGGELRW